MLETLAWRNKMELLTFIPILPVSQNPNYFITNRLTEHFLFRFASFYNITVRIRPRSRPLDTRSCQGSGPVSQFPPAKPTSVTLAYKPSRTRRQFLILAAITSVAAVSAGKPSASAKVEVNKVVSAYDLNPLKNGKPYPLTDLRGKVTLFVNVASYCALTPQYTGLVSLHNTFQPQGFEVIASPCNQFARQEPGSNEDICDNVKKTYGARFLLLDKLVVNESPPEGPVDPLYRFLRDTSPERRGDRVLWNFEKFLVGADGRVLRRYSPGIYPKDLEKDIKFALYHPGQQLPPKPKPYLGVA